MEECRGFRSEECFERCRCVRGFIKNGTECIPHEECMVCSENSQATDCVDTCVPDCHNPSPHCDADTECASGCDCDDGYVKKSNHPFAPCILQDRVSNSLAVIMQIFDQNLYF